MLKMRLVFALFIIVLTEARKKRPQRPVQPENEKPRYIGNVDKYPENFQHPVPFGHLYKDGFGDPTSGLKQPIDLLELDMVRPRNTEEAKKIWESRQKDIQVIPNNIPRRFASPRDQYWYEQQHQNETGVNKVRKNASRTWIDWEAVQHFNVGKRRPFLRHRQPIERPNVHNPNNARSPKTQYFSSGSFDLISNRRDKENWTTCHEFGKIPNFHPKDVVNLDWVPFFVWATMGYHAAVVHRFSYPTKKLVKQYKDEYAGHLNKSLDWEQTKLVLKEAVEILLIAGDRTGMFHGIPHLDIPLSMKNKPIEFPTVTIRLKIEDPYLAIMHCENRFATIMAVAGNEPATDEEKQSEAATLKFKGIGYAVGRNLEAERLRDKAERDWKTQRKEDEVLRIDEPIVRDHFLGKDIMK